MMTTAVVVVLGLSVGGGLVLWRWDTSRQPQLGAYLPLMDEAAAEVLRAAGDDVAVAVSGVFQASVCRLGPLREGGIFVRSADLYTDPGGEDELISRIAATLPAEFRGHREPVRGDDAAALSATVGDGVGLVVHQLGQGWVSATARTECSLATGEPVVPDAPDDAATTTIDGIFAELGTGAAEASWHSLGCPAGGLMATTAVVSRPVDTGDLPERLAGLVPAQARTFGSVSNRLSWRDGGVSVIVAASDDNTAVTVRYTVGC
jgi:hypothetical protein